MTYFKRYFTYRLRATAFRTLILSILAAVLSNAITSVSASANGRNSGMGIIGIFVSIAAILVPMLETYQLKQRRTLDLVFALPVTKSQLAVAHFLSGLCQMATISVVTCLSTMVAIAAKNPQVISRDSKPYVIGWIIPYFLLTLLGGIFLYSVVTFLFSQGNTAGDGAVFAFGAPGGFALLCWYIESMISNYFALHERINGEIIELANCFSLIYEPYRYYKYLVEPEVTASVSIRLPQPPSTLSIVSCVLWILLGIAAFFGFVHHVKSYRAEKAGGISDSFFGYRVLIPLYGCILVAINGTNIDGVFLTFVLVAMVVAYFVYRRSFRIKYADIACVVFAFLTVFTEGVL